MRRISTMSRQVVPVGEGGVAEEVAVELLGAGPGGWEERIGRDRDGLGLGFRLRLGRGLAGRRRRRNGHAGTSLRCGRPAESYT